MRESNASYVIMYEEIISLRPFGQLHKEKNTTHPNGGAKNFSRMLIWNRRKITLHTDSHCMLEHTRWATADQTRVEAK